MALASGISPCPPNFDKISSWIYDMISMLVNCTPYNLLALPEPLEMFVEARSSIIKIPELWPSAVQDWTASNGSNKAEHSRLSKITTASLRNEDLDLDTDGEMSEETDNGKYLEDSKYEAEVARGMNDYINEDMNEMSKL